ncbi:MFS transporter, partial [Pseudomonas aeruginosa]|nr:MFS transporter [Pseudomonas aeruginosa]
LLALFSLSAGLPGAALPLGLLIGLCANACVAGLYALAPSLYDASVRATGVGWGIGVGRGGAILSPLVAGLLLDDGWQPLSLYGAFAAVFVVAAAVLPLLGARRRERSPTLGDAA